MLHYLFDFMMTIPAIALGLGILALYFMPWIIAKRRKKKNSASILVVNLFLGWTLIGWVGALAWAVSESKD